MKDTFEKLRGIPNRGYTHIFMGSPLSNTIDKTTVEPGNDFSPGLWTCGIFPAVKTPGKLISPRTDRFTWNFAEEMPVVEASYKDEDVQIKSRIITLGGEGIQAYDYFEATVEGNAEDAAIIISGAGPAGGIIKHIDICDHDIIIQGGPVLQFETPVRPELYEPDENDPSAYAVIHFTSAVRFKVRHEFGPRMLDDASIQDRREYSVREAFEKGTEEWKRAVPAKIFCPDPRIGKVWEQCAFHILSAMEDGLPRISVCNYPIFWIRDCVIVLKALDLFGRPDLAQSGCEFLAPTIFSGGFGCESDNPGEGLWCLGEHLKFTKDAEWAKAIFPYVKERVLWIERMLTAEKPIHRPGDMRTIWAHYNASSDIVCFKHEGNHIHGRMDWHSPDLYINCWAWAGLDCAAWIADLIGETDLAEKWKGASNQLKKAISEELLPQFGNERDTCVSPWPTGIYQEDTEKIRSLFIEWYDKNRLNQDGTRKAEELWTYFEAAQIHNAILLGEKERAWKCLDGFLDDPKWQGMSIYTESVWGATEMLPFGTGQYGNGWLQEGATGGNMPHNWTTSETAALIRDLFVCEEDEGLVLFSGVPDSWLINGNQFGVENFPTKFGTVTVYAQVEENRKIRVHFESSENIKWRSELCIEREE